MPGHGGGAGLLHAGDLQPLSGRGAGARRGQRVVRFFGQAARRSDDARPRPRGDPFDLHARQAVHAGDRAAVERLARYILRPPLGTARLSLRSDGQVALTLKPPWRDGTAGVVLEPVEFVSRLAALIPKPRVNTIRPHGVYAARARLRKLVVPCGAATGRTSSTASRPATRASGTRSSSPSRRITAAGTTRETSALLELTARTGRSRSGCRRTRCWCLRGGSVRRTVGGFLLRFRAGPLLGPRREHRAPRPDEVDRRRPAR